MRIAQTNVAFMMAVAKRHLSKSSEGEGREDENKKVSSTPNSGKREDMATTATTTRRRGDDDGGGGGGAEAGRSQRAGGLISEDEGGKGEAGAVQREGVYKPVVVGLCQQVKEARGGQIEGQGWTKGGSGIEIGNRRPGQPRCLRSRSPWDTLPGRAMAQRRDKGEERLSRFWVCICIWVQPSNVLMSSLPVTRLFFQFNPNFAGLASFPFGSRVI